MKQDIVKTITRNAIVAAIYFLLTFMLNTFGSGVIQIRISEALVLLCFYRRDYTYGVTLGCFLANFLSPIGFLDLFIGTAATLVSCLLVSFCKHLLLSTLIPVVINGVAIGLEFAFIAENSQPFWYAAGFVALGEFISVCIIGYLLFRFLLTKNQAFMETIGANKNLDYKW